MVHITTKIIVQFRGIYVIYKCAPGSLSTAWHMRWSLREQPSEVLVLL